MNASHSRILGAVAIGVGLVGGAYLLQNFGDSGGSMPVAVATVTNQAMPRTAIAVTDSDQDGVEDWREEFLTAEPIRQPATSSNYTPPDTLTGQIGIEFFENYMLNKVSGPIARDPEELASMIAGEAISRSQAELFGRADIEIVPATPDNIRAYGNGLADALKRHSIEVDTNELILLRRSFEEGDQEAAAQIAAFASTTEGYRDDTLNLAVPRGFEKPHLDLMNVYHAIHENFLVFTQPKADPIRTMIHARKHQDDVRALGIALANMYDALLPHASAFERNDPALLFVELTEAGSVGPARY